MKYKVIVTVATEDEADQIVIALSRAEEELDFAFNVEIQEEAEEREYQGLLTDKFRY